MKLGYVIGPYRAGSVWEITRNIERARECAAELWRMGAAVICPHSNTALMDGVVSDNAFLRGDKAILKRCDFAVCLEGWRHSVGSVGEVMLCNQNDIQDFNWPDDRERIEEFLRGGE